MPKINATILPKDDYLTVKGQVRRHYEKCGVPNHIEACSIKEWGEIIDGCACVLKTTVDYLVLIRSDSPHSLEEDLRHEFRHIHNGDADK